MKTIKSKIHDLERYTNINIENFYDYYSTNYISDMISEEADNSVSIYNHDLKSWLQKECRSPRYMEEVIGEGFIDTSNYCFYDHVRAANYLYNRDEIEYYNTEIVEYIFYNYLVDQGGEDIPLGFTIDYIDYDLDDVDDIKSKAIDCIDDYNYKLEEDL